MAQRGIASVAEIIKLFNFILNSTPEIFACRLCNPWPYTLTYSWSKCTAGSANGLMS